ncbi:MAG: hypothetical protein HYY93_12905 [Planctomycetes bacterium]|nr:hypothetical protein [Planctomycetota bacterium]
MIRINLLPPELRTAERTPLGRFMAMIAMIVVVLGVWSWAGVKYQEVRALQEQLDSKTSELELLQKRVKDEYEPLVARLAVLTKRLDAGKALEVERTIGGLARWKWTEAIDEVWDVIWKSPKVWITNINCTEGGGGSGLPSGAKADATLSMDCFAASTDFSGMTDFRRRLQEHPKIPKRFIYMNKPLQVTVVKDPSIKEGGKLQFRIELYAVPPAKK